MNILRNVLCFQASKNTWPQICVNSILLNFEFMQLIHINTISKNDFTILARLHSKISILKTEKPKDTMRSHRLIVTLHSLKINHSTRC